MEVEKQATKPINNKIKPKISMEKQATIQINNKIKPKISILRHPTFIPRKSCPQWFDFKFLEKEKKKENDKTSNINKYNNNIVINLSKSEEKRKLTKKMIKIENLYDNTTSKSFKNFNLKESLDRYVKDYGLQDSPNKTP